MRTTIMETIEYQSKSGVLSTQIAITSFAVGTLIMLLHFAWPAEDFILIGGLFFVAIALLINAAMLLLLIYFFLKEAEHREYFAIKILIVLSNIPVVIFYTYIVINSFQIF